MFLDTHRNLPSIDLEIMAINLALEKFQIYLNKERFLIRTDCLKIVKFYCKSNSNKLAGKRWINFENVLSSNRFRLIFEHIDGTSITLADWLSRSPEKPR